MGKVVVYMPRFYVGCVSVDGARPPFKKISVLEGEYIRLGVDSCASMIDRSRFRGRLSAEGVYVVVGVDRDMVGTDHVENLKKIWDYGDHHGGEYAALWKVEDLTKPWKIVLHSWGYKKRDLEHHALRGEGAQAEDYTDEYERETAPQI
ncbi:hypothetical protein [Thermogutta sp.]|uniref:hypothetical protein n=1 Tax=Thermogutta sp. TaxID=1962930 RepID=UPI00321FF7FD